jgi:hypothetical protein
MRLTRATRTIFLILALVSLAVWFRLSYPTLAFTNFTVDRPKALRAAQDHLKARGVDPSRFLTATIFISEKKADQYLQRAIGFNRLKVFAREHDFDMFFWVVRFFNEREKEEYRLSVNSSTGEVTSLSHTVDESEARRPVPKEEARQAAEGFLRARFAFNPDRYAAHSDITTTLDHRTEYFFSWQKKDVNIPWSKEENSGTGKLITSARVSGDEVLSFSKNTFLVPDQFTRDLAKKTDTGVNLSYILKFITTLLFAASIFFIIVRRNHLAMHATKRFYLGVMLVSFILSLAAHLNIYQDILFNYRTTSSFQSYLWQVLIGAVNEALFATIGILMPSLAGELLRYEVFRDRKGGSFLYYTRSTFFSRHVTEMVGVGYFIFIVMLGIQSVLVEFGQKYLGVWVEHTWVENLSATQLPFLSTFTYGYKTSLSEEIMYRLFALCLFKKLFDKLWPGKGRTNLWVAAAVSSVVWGFAHSGYPVFPMWFRGVEITILGFFLSFMYLRYGIIPVIVGHYLFNIFWHSAEHLLGVSPPFYFYSSLSVLLLPFIFGLIAFWADKKDEARPPRWRLTQHQLFNLEVLKAFLEARKDAFAGRPKEHIVKEIVSHGWDPAVVDVAVEYLMDKTSSAAR